MTFNLYPAIDLKDGQCVRLLRGEMDQATQYNPDPGDQAAQFKAAGFEYLHVVDLNGAFDGASANTDAVKSILGSTSVPVQLGGGIRTRAHIDTWLEAGISRVILGTVALRDPALVKAAARALPGQVVVGIDAKDGMVAVEGWAETSDMEAVELAKAFEGCGVAALIVTDIARDGMLTGPNYEELETMLEVTNIPMIASGGVANIDDRDTVLAGGALEQPVAVVARPRIDREAGVPGWAARL